MAAAGGLAMLPLDFGTAIVGTVQFAIALAFFGLGQYASRRINSRVGASLISWPCYGIAFIFGLSAIFTMYWNMFGPIVLWFVGLF